MPTALSKHRESSDMPAANAVSAKFPPVSANSHSRTPEPAEFNFAGASRRLDEVTFLRLPEVKAITGLSKSSLYALIKEKSFPAPVQLGARAVAWVRSEVVQWTAERVHASRSLA